MKTKISHITALPFCFIMLQVHAQSKENIQPDRQQHCSLGDFKLENGEIIYDCKVGYRAYGKPDATKSNIILWPTYITGTSANHETLVPGKYIDTTAWYLIVVDALGNGVSSSPSNSSKQPRLRFPQISTRDMVESQYMALTKNLDIQHVHAIAGISMGGLQAFQWAVSYPEFADKIIPLVGSPQATTYDQLLFNSLLHAIKSDTAYRDGNYTELPEMRNESLMWNLIVTSPERVIQTVSRDSFDNWFIKIQRHGAYDWNDFYRQSEAVIGHDIAKPFKSSLQEAGKMIKAKMLIIVAKRDYVVNSSPAIKLAELTNARLIILDTNCGHASLDCEFERVVTEIKTFLAEG